MSGWIKLHRQLLKWEWFTDVNTCHLFIYLLLSANYEDRKWHGIVIKRGQHCATRDELMRGTGLSAREIRTAVTKLKTTRVLSVERPNKITVYTIDKYEEYQHQIEGSDQGNDQGCVTSTTKERPKNDQYIDKEIKEIKEIKKKEKIILSSELKLTSVSKKILNPIDIEFEEFWNLYPVNGIIKGPKKDALKKFHILRQTISFETILQEVKNYADYLGSSGQTNQHTITWLNEKGRNGFGVNYTISATSSIRSRQSIKKTQNELAREAVFGIEG